MAGAGEGTRSAPNPSANRRHRIGKMKRASTPPLSVGRPGCQRPEPALESSGAGVTAGACRPRRRGASCGAALAWIAAAIDGRQDPHLVPARVQRITSAGVQAPDSMAESISRSLTPSQRQTYMRC